MYKATHKRHAPIHDAEYNEHKHRHTEIHADWLLTAFDKMVVRHFQIQSEEVERQDVCR